MSSPAPMPGLVFDDEAIEAHRQVILERMGPDTWRSRLREGASTGLRFYGTMLLLQLGEPLARFLAHPWKRLGIPLLASIPVALFSVVINRRVRGQLPALALASIKERHTKQWHTLNGPGWRRRTMLLGMGIGAACGVFVGALASTRPGIELWRGSVPLTIAALVAGMWLWSIPAAFWIRHISLEQTRRLLLQEPRTP